MGKQVRTDSSGAAAKKLLKQKFEKYLTKMDESPLMGSQKTWTFDKVFQSKIALNSSGVTFSFVKELAKPKLTESCSTCLEL